MRDTTLIVAVGEALFGSRWQTDLAAALSADDRIVALEDERYHILGLR